jgi:ADP-heptose:LPS heptosyltransferase
MRILALQLKRIGDLVLTTPALAALKARSDVNLTLAVDTGTADLLPAIPQIDSTIVFGRGRGWAPWQQVLTGQFDAVYDFTGTDRSALAAVLSRAKSRTTFAWIRKRRFRSFAYNAFVDSSVRERHTVDHYLDLIAEGGAPVNPNLNLNPSPSVASYAVLHPGTARPEKFWLADRWVEVAQHLSQVHGLRVILTTGPDELERAHAREIQSAIRDSHSAIVETPSNLCEFARVLAGAAVVVSVDTAAVHLAAAFQRPQVALFGPTNPFHWRPRHTRAAVVSATQPEAPMTQFQPRMKGAPTDRIPVRTVVQAVDAVLSETSPYS